MNWAIGRQVYYSGSLYDIPLVAAMAWLTWIGLRTKAEKPASDVREASTLYGVWIARCSMIAVFSLPVFAAWAMSDASSPLACECSGSHDSDRRILHGRNGLVRQHLLDRELTQLLQHSRQSFDSLKHLQAQVLQSEKLASIGQLVGGAAHELNNPITAMLGYSDMLLSTPLTAEQRPLAAKIGQYVRRTKSLVASLISFARQTPSPKSPIDLNTLARTAVKLTQPQWEALEIEVRTQFDPALPKVLGDSNQLLQVCLQLVANCLHVLSRAGRPSADRQHATTGGNFRASNRHRTDSRSHIDQHTSLFPDRIRRRVWPERVSRHPARAPRSNFAGAPRRWRHAATRGTPDHRVGSSQDEGIYSAGAVAISTVRLS